MRISDDVVLCTNGPAELDEQQRSTLKRCGVTVREDPVVRVEGRPDAFERVVFASGGELARGALFVRASLRQHSGLAALRRRGADALQLTADVYEKLTSSFRLRLSSKKWG